MKRYRAVCIACVFAMLLVGPIIGIAGAENTAEGYVQVINSQWTSYTNGNWINDLAFDSDGYLWAASSGGAVCWDTEMETYVKYTSEYGLCSNQLSAVAIAPDGTVWFTSLDNGVSIFKDGIFTTYTMQDGLPSNIVEDIAVASDGTVWVATYSGIASFDGENWKVYADGPGKEIITKVVCDLGGNVWFATEHQGLFRLSGTEWTRYDASTGFSNTVLDLTLADNGTVWASFLDVGLIFFSGEEIVRYPLEDSEFASIRCFHIDEAGMLWAASGQIVGCLIDGEWEYYRGDNTLHLSFKTACMVSGPDGTLWFGGFNGGLSGYRDGDWTVLKTDDWLPDNAVEKVMVTADGALWILSNTAVTYFDGTAAQVYPLRRNAWDLIIASDETVWVSFLSSGIYRFDGSLWTYYGPGNSPNGFQDSVDFTTAPIKLKSGIKGNEWYIEIMPDQDGKLLCRSSFGKVHSLSEGQWSVFKTPVDSITDIIRSSQGVYWISSSDGLFSSTDGKKWKSYPEILDADYYIYNSGALYIMPDGTCWIGSSSGLGCQPVEGDSFIIRRGDGIPNDEIYCITGKSDNIVWIGTFDTWSMTGGSGAAEYDGTTWQTFTASDGLSSNAVLDITAMADSVWFATLGGSEHVPDAIGAVE